MLGLSFSSQPGSRQFYVLTLGVASTWMVGGLRSGPLNLGWVRPASTLGEDGDRTGRRAPAFGAFYGAALIARRVPVLSEAVTSALRYASRALTPFCF